MSIKVKTSELTGAALDYAVSVAKGYEARYQPHFVTLSKIRVLSDWDWAEPYEPSTDPAQGHPIIEREKIGTNYIGALWHAEYDNALTPANEHKQSGPTPLIAAMRCYVASKLGAEVEVPEELL